MCSFVDGWALRIFGLVQSAIQITTNEQGIRRSRNNLQRRIWCSSMGAHVVSISEYIRQGYRAKAVAHRAGKQLVLQPDFTESDKQFNRNQTLRSAFVATDRGGNEREVNVSKRSWYVKQGFQPNSDPKQMNDAWLTWSFKSNFMFAPVL